MASGIASALIAIDPSNKAAKRYLQNRKGKMAVKVSSPKSYPVSEPAPRTEQDWLAAEKRLEEGYQAIMVEARLLREEIEAVQNLGGIQAEDKDVLSNLRSISEGRVNEAVSMGQPVSARETARLNMETPERC